MKAIAKVRNEIQPWHYGVLCAALLAAGSVRAEVGKNESPLPMDLKTGNLRVAPAVLFGNGSLSYDMAVSEKMTVGPTLGRRSASLKVFDVGTDLTSYTVGVTARYHLSGPRFMDGWVMSGNLSYLPSSMSYSTGFKEYSGSLSGIGVSADIGYQWMWKSGLNLSLGAGLAFSSLPSEQTLTASDGSQMAAATPAWSGITPDVELTVGYAF